MTVGLLDTSYESDNDGDAIIVDAILERFPSLGRSARLPTHRHLTKSERTIAARSEMLVLTGTNILTSNPWRDRQWRLSIATLAAIRNKVVFLGVGWRQYQPNPGRTGTALMRNLVHPDLPIASRDEYTHAKLQGLGIESINTGCPTTWKLPPQVNSLGQSTECVFTFTSYNPDRQYDPQLLSSLCKKYQSVHVWPQGFDDEKNVSRMSLPENAYVLPRGTESLNRALDGRDYVGTRLHAGIRAAQLGRPSMVVAVDNRAVEIGRDTGFPVVPRKTGIDGFETSYRKFCGPASELKINHDNIKKWTTQFESFLGLERIGPCDEKV